jgi:hypothetical protein
MYAAQDNRIIAMWKSSVIHISEKIHHKTAEIIASMDYIDSQINID